ncbi:MAG: hypothetical protein K2H29_08650 [Oscillospiraceae bacterium]|nr:hypothetical protein [Oscillospiraceae bacterium]
MNISPNNEKIEKYLDELADEYKELLYKALISRSRAFDNLSVSELLRLDNEIKRPLFEDYKRKQKRRRMLFKLGLMYILTGATLFIFSEITKGDFLYHTENILQVASAIIGVFGMLISIYSFASQQLDLFSKKHMNEYEDKYYEYEAIATWRELEGMVNDISINKNVKISHSIIEYLSEIQFINKEEYNILKEFLKMRNNIIHSNNNEYSSDEIKEMLDKVNRIVDKIRKII